MQKMTRWGLTFLFSLIGSWIGAAMDHNNWMGVPSLIFGAIGLIAGYWISGMLDDYISG